MDIKIEARNSTSKIKVQHLPFNIKYDGPARLASYFVAKKTTHLYEGKHVLQAGFRGRLLTGLPITLPTDYTGCIFRDSDQLAYKSSADSNNTTTSTNDDGDNDDEVMPDPHSTADTVREWRLMGTFHTLLSWQRRTDNQLDADQFVDEQAAAVTDNNNTTTSVVHSTVDVPPAPPAPNMTTLSHKTALFNWMRWLDVGQTIHAPITAAQIARVQEQDLLAATEAVKSESATSNETSEAVKETADSIMDSASSASNTNNETTSSTRKRKHDAVEQEEDETSSPANKKQRND